MGFLPAEQSDEEQQQEDDIDNNKQSEAEEGANDICHFISNNFYCIDELDAFSCLELYLAPI